MIGRVLVTGSSGFVGGALGAWLRRVGWSVVGLSRSAPRPGSCDTFVRWDLAANLPDIPGPLDAVVHCAALASPWARPSDYEAANVAALRNVIAFAELKRPRRFVFLSSSAVHYAYADQFDLAEDTLWPERSVNMYAETKRRGEAMVRASALAWTILRPRAVFGPGDTVVFPRILHAAARGALPRLMRLDGQTPVADLLYIDNLCGWIEQVLARDKDGVFLLANGEPVETTALLIEILERLGLPPLGRALPVWAAMALARLMELQSRTVGHWREPPVTRLRCSEPGLLQDGGHLARTP